MWTHFSDEDRQMLTRIVERWGTLSDELKRAVLAVVGGDDAGIICIDMSTFLETNWGLCHRIDSGTLPIVGRPPTGKSRKEIVRESQARRRAKYGGVSISLQVDKELHRSLKKAAEKDNTTLSDYITELFLKHVKFKSSIVKNPKWNPTKKVRKGNDRKKTPKD